jgi:hypothetical protein
MATTFTQAHLTLIEAAIQATITNGSMGAGSFSLGGVTINGATSLDELWKLHARVKAILDGEAGTQTVATKLDGVDL